MQSTRERRQGIRDRARDCCEYCMIPFELTAMPMEIDHIQPQAKSGTEDDDNLAWACLPCNRHKGVKTHARNPETRRRVRLFHPRDQQWSKHFRWSEDGRIVGLTPRGKATINALNMNRPEIIRLRKKLVKEGWHPPHD